MGSAILGGDPGMGALAGLAGGTIGYVGGRAWPLGADAVAGGVASVIQGGDFGEGAANGAYYNLAATAGGLLAPMPTLGQQDVQKGDAIYLKPDGPVNALISFFEGGVFSHTGTMVSKTEMVQSSIGDNGVRIVNTERYKGRGAYVSQRFRGNQEVVNQALTVANRQKINYGFLPGQKVCSTCNAYVYNKAGNSGWYGIGPNSQASGMGYSQFHITRMYGE